MWWLVEMHSLCFPELHSFGSLCVMFALFCTSHCLLILCGRNIIWFFIYAFFLCVLSLLHANTNFSLNMIIVKAIPDIVWFSLFFVHLWILILPYLCSCYKALISFFVTHRVGCLVESGLWIFVSELITALLSMMNKKLLSDASAHFQSSF